VARAVRAAPKSIGQQIKALLQPVNGGTIYIAHGVDSIPNGDRIRLFEHDGLEYHSFCDDFGPMNMSSIVHFIEQLQDAILPYPDAKTYLSKMPQILGQQSVSPRRVHDHCALQKQYRGPSRSPHTCLALLCTITFCTAQYLLGTTRRTPDSRCSGSFELKRMQVQLVSAIYNLASDIYKLVLWKRCTKK
jgi:hypothetical protein